MRCDVKMNVSLFKYKDILIGSGKIAVGLLVITLLTGCLQNYGRLKRDPQIQRDFETYAVPSNYNYYYFGVSSHPWAVMGLDPEYKLKSRLWREVDPNTERFRKMVYWTWSDLGYYIYGAHILDPDEQKFGIFYSSVWFAAVKVDRETKTVEVMPHLFLGEP